ncbi:MAG TPA: cytochrome C oxidase subunit IV family protein [Croceibacterium sp.]|nr:cytochrome C oxidase subunit IV family protein [Croceibacterium sp.]
MKNVRAILCTWAALLMLLALTIGASFAPLGPVLPFVSYSIALAKTALIVWLFMEMKTRDGLERLAFATGFVWLFFLFTLTFVDELTRSWIGH